MDHFNYYGCIDNSLVPGFDGLAAHEGQGWPEPLAFESRHVPSHLVCQLYVGIEGLIQAFFEEFHFLLDQA